MVLMNLENMQDPNQLRLEKLKESCLAGNPSAIRLNYMLKEPPSRYSANDVQFLENWLTNSDEQTSILILKVLCRFGNNVSKYIEKFKSISSRMSMEIMKIASKQNDPETILNMVSEDKQNVNNAVILLNQMGRKEYLASFLFSQNNELVELIKSIK